MQGADHQSAVAVARGDRQALGPAVEALLELVEQVTLRPAETTAEHVERARQAGWSDDQLSEAIYVTATFAFFNRVADGFGIPSLDRLGM